MDRGWWLLIIATILVMLTSKMRCDCLFFKISFITSRKSARKARSCRRAVDRFAVRLQISFCCKRFMTNIARNSRSIVVKICHVIFQTIAILVLFLANLIIITDKKSLC